MRVLWATLFIVIADQVTKVLVRTQMQYGESIPVIGDLLKWTFTENPGMAFGVELGGGDAGKLFLTVFSVVATGLILLYLRHVRLAPFGYRMALALILGGALGNVIDRVFYSVLWGYGPLGFGNVVDFIHIDVWSGRLPASWPLVGDTFVSIFPIGNIADLAIIGGVVAVLTFQRAFHDHIRAAEAAVDEGEPVAVAVPVGAHDAVAESPVEAHTEPPPPSA